MRWAEEARKIYCCVHLGLPLDARAAGLKADSEEREEWLSQTRHAADFPSLVTLT